MNTNKPQEIDAKEVHQALENKEIILVDVRNKDAYDEAHAAGAISIPIDELEARLSELPEDTQIVTSCGGGTRGPRAAQLLADLGRDAKVMQGGFRGWKKAELPTK